MRRSTILDVVVRAEFHTLILVALYLLFAGHNQPGGGFSGGLVAGSALALQFVAEGPERVRRTVRVAPTTLLGAGLVVAVTTALVPLATGRSLLQHGHLTITEPVLGTAHLTSATAFDTGVFLVVVGMVSLMLDALGREEPAPVDPGRPLDPGQEDRP